MGVFADIRDDIRELFGEAYLQHPVVHYSFVWESIPDMQSTARERAVEAYYYNPDTPVGRVKSFLSGLASVIEVILLIAFIVGVISGGSLLVLITRMGLEVMDSLQSLLLSAVLGGSTAIGVLAALLLIWLHIIAASPTVVQTFNRGLVIGPKDIVRTDTKPELAGIIVWNSSLVGTGALKLVNIFSILYILSAIPGWDPYEFMHSVLKNNMDAFVNVDCWRDAARVLFHRLYG